MKKPVCPDCGTEGKAVLPETVRSLIREGSEDKVTSDIYYLCMKSDCMTAYYDEKGNTITTDEIRVPIWFKKGADPVFICYCSKVTEDDIKSAILKHGITDTEEVIRFTGACRDQDCRKNNPSGKCCRKSIAELVEKTLR